MRLDKYIASVTELSRKQVRQAVRDRQVRIDGLVATDASRHIDKHSRVSCGGSILRTPGFRYFMLHKPAGVVCATRDSHHRTAIDLLDIACRETLQIAGRLDIDTTGLVLITDDGQWNHRLTSPRYGCIKRYELTTELPIDAALIEQFAQGIVLQPENTCTRPAQLQLLGPRRAQLGISEGRYHQVKRMFHAVGNAVVTLHRSSVGNIELDSTLQPGQFRPLTADEIATAVP